MTPFAHILVPTDFSDCANRAVTMAIDLAAKLDAKVTLLHICESPAVSYAAYAGGLYFPMEDVVAAAQKVLDAAVSEGRKRAPNLKGVLGTGDALEQILATAGDEKMDLIVMGTHGRRGISRAFLGSIAEKTVRFASIPVLTVSGHIPAA